MKKIFLNAVLIGRGKETLLFNGKSVVDPGFIVQDYNSLSAINKLCDFGQITILMDFSFVIVKAYIEVDYSNHFKKYLHIKELLVSST